MSNWIPTVRTVSDGTDTVSGSTVNPIIASLAGRDQYLFDRIDSYEDKSVLISYSVPVSDGGVEVGTVVYYKPSDGLYKALGTYRTSVDPNHLIPGEESLVFGVVKALVTSGSLLADVYIRGLIDVVIDDLLDSASAEAEVKTGSLYLSSLEAGKLTLTPGGASVFVGQAVSATQLFLAPNVDSLNQLHFNYRVYLRDVPAGTPANSSGTWSVTSPDFDKTGWVLASSAHSEYGYDIPTGAKFFYNLPTAAAINEDDDLTDLEKKDALLLKNALPPYPAAYTMLFINGVLQHAYDEDHSTGIYIINNSGLWWCNDSTAYKPWYTSPDPRLTLVLQTTKLNPHYKSAVVTSLSAYVDNSNDSSTVLSFLDAETGAPATAGDIRVKFNLSVDSEAQSPVGGTFVKDVTFDETEGKLVLQTSPGIVSLAAGPGVSVSTTAGIATVSLSNFSLSGLVEDIEPEDAEFVYKGLHSYLRIKNPAAGQRIGFVGKLTLPPVIPANQPLHVKMMLFGETTSSSYPVKFKFEYSVSKLGALISDAVYKPNSGADIDVSNFTANIAQLVEKTGSTYYFEVPAAHLVPGAFLNFRIARVLSNYQAAIGVVGVYWAVE